MAAGSGDTCILHRRIQIIEQLCGLLGCPGVGALVVRNLELVAAFEDLPDQFVMGFKCLGHCVSSFLSLLGVARGLIDLNQLSVLIAIQRQWIVEA